MKSIMDIGTSTQLCAVIGNPVEHSLSPAIHNRAFQELGLDFVYLAFRVEDAKSVAMGMRALENFRGLSVTIPHKVAIIEHLDEIAEVDRQIGSVNTVVNENGKLIGSGSDGPGARMALIDSLLKPFTNNWENSLVRVFSIMKLRDCTTECIPVVILC